MADPNSRGWNVSSADGRLLLNNHPRRADDGGRPPSGGGERCGERSHRVTAVVVPQPTAARLPAAIVGPNLVWMGSAEPKREQPSEWGKSSVDVFIFVSGKKEIIS